MSHAAADGEGDGSDDGSADGGVDGSGSGEQSPVRLRDLALSVYLPSVLYGIGQGAVAPVVVISALELGASAAVAFLVAAAAGLGVVVANLPAGQVVSRIGERRAMLYAVVLAVVALIGCVLAPSVWVLAVAIASTGISTAVWALARQVWIAETVPYELRSRAMATMGGVNRAGVFLGPFLAAGVIAIMGTDGAYWLHVVTALAAGGVLLVVRGPAMPAAAEGTDTSTRGTLRIMTAHLPVLRTLGTGALLVSATRAARQSVIPLWATRQGLDPATASLVFGISGAADLVLFYPAGVAMDRFGRRGISVLSMIILGGSFVLLPFAHSLEMITAVAVLMGVGNGMSAGLVMTLGADAAPVGQRGQFLGAFRVWSDTGTFAGPLVVSAVAAAFAVVPAIVVMGGVGMLAAGALLRWVPVVRSG